MQIDDLNRLISEFLGAITLPAIATFLAALVTLWAKSFSQRVLSMWSAKQFFGTGPKSWVSISTPIGSEIGQVVDITLKWIIINMVNNSRKFVPTASFDQNTWNLLQKKAIIEAEHKMKRIEEENSRKENLKK